jgi:hypothetical protein
MKRVLPIAAIPSALWNNSTLLLPTSLTCAYEEELASRGLLSSAKKGTKDKDIHGGTDAAATLKHFSFRFAVSVGRVEFVAIAPNEKFAEVSDALMSTFSEGHVALLDIPCGTGSCLGAILSTLLVLREAKVAPTQPLTISVVAGDTSPKALEIYESMISRLLPLLQLQAINVNLLLEQWDATRSDETARLVDRWYDLAEGAEEYVVCISNFNGALISAGLLDAFTPCFEQILGRLYNKKSTLLWVEPVTSSAKEKLFPRIAAFIKNRIPWFTSTSAVDEPIATSYLTQNPLDAYIHSSGVQVQRFERT